MVLFNYSTRELTAKIVYYGPGLCGKTSNLQYVYDSLPDSVKKGKMLSLATKTDRTLFFDFLPIELGQIRGMKTRLQLYTVPGQVFYNSTRKLVLKGADGVVFVADSQGKMLEANAESYKNLEDNLREMGIRLEEIPLVMQFNKRDLPNLASVEEMNTEINRHNAPFYEAVATTGIGVEDTLKAITKLVLNNLSAKYKLEGGGPPAEAPGPRPAADRPPAVAAPRPAPPPRAAAPARAVAPAAARSAAAPAHEPYLEEGALDLEEVEPLETPLPPSARRAVRPAAAPSPPARPHAAPSSAPADEEIFDLGDVIDLPGLEEPQSGTIDLGEDLLQELEEEPVRAAMPQAPARPPARAAAPGPPLRAVRAEAPAAIEEPLDLDEPLDLGEEWDEPAPSTSSPGPDAPIDIGPLAPGQEKAIDVPVTATINGRPVRLTLKVTVRLPR